MSALVETYVKPIFHSFQSSTATTISTTTTSSVNSSCSYDSGSSPFNCNNISNVTNISSNWSNSKFIEPNELISSITEAIILDCRVLRDYENKHIENSVHINCRDKITKKRLSSKKLSVKDIIGCEDVKKKFEYLCSKIDCSNLVVIYDDATNDENDLFLDQNPLQIVLDNIIQTCKARNCKILKGGFKEFSQLYPNACAKKEKVNLSQPINNVYANCEELCRHAIENARMTKILDYLFLGNECDAQNEEALKKENITHIINVTKNIKCHFKNSIKYWEIPVNDTFNQNLKKHFDDAIEFIENAKNSGGKVLVHCQAGISRSSTVCIAYLMKTRGYKMNEAHQFIRQKRSIIDPNVMFLAQLGEYEKELDALKSKEESQKKSTINNNTITKEQTIMCATIGYSKDVMQICTSNNFFFKL